MCETSEFGTSDQFLVPSDGMMFPGQKMTSALAAVSFVESAKVSVATTTVTAVVAPSGSSTCQSIDGGAGSDTSRSIMAAMGLALVVSLLLALLISLYFRRREKQKNKKQRYQFAQMSERSYPIFVTAPGELRSELEVGTKRQNTAHRQGSLAAKFELSSSGRPTELGH